MAPVHVRRKRLRIAAPAVLQWSSRVLVSDTESSVELDPVAGHRRRPTGHRDGISPAEDIARVRDGVFFDEPDIRRRFSRFWLLLILTGVIADSTATVIRAMIVAPLMTPILVSGIVVMAVHRAWFQSSETKTNGPQPAPDSSTLRTSLDDAGLSSTTVRVELVPENVAVLSGG